MRKLVIAIFLLLPLASWAIPENTPITILDNKGITNKTYTHVTAQEITLFKYGNAIDVLDMPENWQACVNASYAPAVIREADLCRCVLYALTDGTVGNPIYELHLRCPDGTDRTVYTNAIR